MLPGCLRLPLWLAYGVCAHVGCGTVDLGDHPEVPELALDEDFFHCEIQPLVLTEYRCARGADGEGGSCHAAQSALRLEDVSTPARCRDGRILGVPPQDAENNLSRLRTAIGIDAESSPLYRRPLGLDSHPRRIFDDKSEAATLLRRWLDQGTP